MGSEVPIWVVPPGVLLAVLVCLAIALVVWWHWERRTAAHRSVIHGLHLLCEDVVRSESASEVIKKLSTRLPDILNITRIELYLHDEGAGRLERLKTDSKSKPRSLRLDTTRGAVAGGAALCFRNATLLAIPNAARSPLFSAADDAAAPHSLLFVPARVGTDVVAVLQIDHDEKVRRFSLDEQAALQHLANMVGATLRSQEQHSVREQVFRSEKLAATAQLMSGVARELRGPLEAISRLAGRLRALSSDPRRHRDLEAMHMEAIAATEIVTRLGSFAGADKAGAELLDVRAILQKALRQHGDDLKRNDIVIRSFISSQRVPVLGSANQLEQVLDNLIVHIIEALKDAPERTISVTAAVRGKHVLVELGCSGDPDDDPFSNDSAGAGALGLAVCQGIIQNHGGSLRVVKTPVAGARFEIELPLPHQPLRSDSAGVQGDVRVPVRTLTALLVEPDRATQRHLLRLLDARGHRAIIVASAEEGIELIQRLHFDLSFCAIRLNSMNWVEYFQLVRHQVNAFVLLTEGYDQDLARAFEGSQGFLLRKPVAEAEFDRLFTTIESLLENEAVAGNA